MGDERLPHSPRFLCHRSAGIRHWGEAELCSLESMRNTQYGCLVPVWEQTHKNISRKSLDDYESVFYPHPEELFLPPALPCTPPVWVPKLWGQRLGDCKHPGSQETCTWLVVSAELQLSQEGNRGRQLLGSALHEGTNFS